MTPWRKHIETWTACTRCPLCNQRDKICLGRGSLPCDVAFIGEAPGTSENDLGYPFAGPAGHLLNEWVAFALECSISEIKESPIKTGYTNLVACFPRDAKLEGDHQPEPSEIKACQPRLKEFLGMCRPRLKLIVCVGALSMKWIQKARIELGVGDVKVIHITHPSAVLQANIAQKDMMAQMARVTLATAIQELNE